jgi:hypothetical protein
MLPFHPKHGSHSGSGDAPKETKSSRDSNSSEESRDEVIYLSYFPDSRAPALHLHRYDGNSAHESVSTARGLRTYALSTFAFSALVLFSVLLCRSRFLSPRLALESDCGAAQRFSSLSSSSLRRGLPVQELPPLRRSSLSREKKTENLLHERSPLLSHISRNSGEDLSPRQERSRYS